VVNAALIISILALLFSVFVGFAVMELIAAGPAASSAAATTDSTLQEVALPDEVLNTPASKHGLPSWLDDTASHLVLFVSPVCKICKELVESFSGAIPDGLTLAITAADERRQRAWATELSLPAEALVFDTDRVIVDSLGVTGSPTAVGFGGGKVLFAMAVGGPSALAELLEQRELAESNEPITIGSKKG